MSKKADLIESLWLKGFTMKNISDTIGCNMSYIQNVARKRGLPMRLIIRGNDPYRVDMWPYIVFWIKKGYSEKEIKDGLGYGQRTEL